MAKYRSKIVEIDAFRYDFDEFPNWFLDAVEARTVRFPRHPLREADIHTLEGVMTAKAGDWIIRGTEGEIYPCKPSVFERKYEPASLPSPTEDRKGA